MYMSCTVITDIRPRYCGKDVLIKKICMFLLKKFFQRRDLARERKSC